MPLSFRRHSVRRSYSESFVHCLRGNAQAIDLEAKQLADRLRLFSARLRERLDQPGGRGHLQRADDLEAALLQRIAIWPDLSPIEGLLQTIVQRADELGLWQSNKPALTDFFSFYTRSTQALLGRAVPLWSRRPLRDLFEEPSFGEPRRHGSRSLSPTRHFNALDCPHTYPPHRFRPVPPHFSPKESSGTALSRQPSLLGASGLI